MEIIDYMLKCICLRNTRKNRQSLKRHFMFEKGKHKLLEELDVVTILKSIRQVKLMTQVLLS